MVAKRKMLTGSQWAVMNLMHAHRAMIEYFGPGQVGIRLPASVPGDSFQTIRMETFMSLRAAGYIRAADRQSSRLAVEYRLTSSGWMRVGRGARKK